MDKTVVCLRRKNCNFRIIGDIAIVMYDGAGWQRLTKNFLSDQNMVEYRTTSFNTTRFISTICSVTII